MTASQNPTVLVGTLASGEAELEESKAVIARQSGVTVEHVVISGLPELEAHNRLFQLWNDRRNASDLFVKVDGDTILKDDSALRRIYDLFKDDEVTAAQIPLHDFFTNDLLVGLNCFSPVVSFGLSDDPLYCDRMQEIGHKRILRDAETASVTPIGWHCKYPHPRQAFHFGYRRFLKGQTDIVRKVMQAWQHSQEEGRVWALAGARAAFLHPLTETSYNAPEFEALFSRQQRRLERHDFDATSIIGDLNRIFQGSASFRLRRLFHKVAGRFETRGPDARSA
jgi:hypothetical protein